jgi:sterol desaturase/sphingolipid hydroxylase (fatty acid hydroxylase superfamily)
VVDLWAFERSVFASLWLAMQVLALSAVFFGGLALLIKGSEAVAAARRAIAEIRVNFSLYVLDTIFVAPVLGTLTAFIGYAAAAYSLVLVRPAFWTFSGRAVTLVAVLFVGDFVSYWRHRFEHTHLLWPTHAVHHSDEQMNWLTLARFHPIDRLTTTAIDTAGLALLGFPQWALVANVIIRHYYGEFIHADLPWTYGPVGRIFVSPAMHRWHHARDVVGAGSNFTTIFSAIDWAFGTYYLPGLCTVPLGVTDEMGSGTVKQLIYPLVAWTNELTAWFRKRRSTPATQGHAGAKPKVSRAPEGAGHV